MIKAGIVGGAQKAAGELIRILIHHPDVEIAWVNSEAFDGGEVTLVHRGLVGETTLQFTSEFNFDAVDVLFLCLPAGESLQFMERFSESMPEQLRVIDLSGDFRIAAETHNFVYGLSEVNRKHMVHDCYRVANPGPFAMALELALLPLASNLLLNSDIHATAIASSNATDRGLLDGSENVCVLEPLGNELTREVEQTLKLLQLSFGSHIYLIPMQGSFARGLLAAVYVKCNVDLDVIRQLYEDYYDDHNFTFIVDGEVNLRDVVNTNKCLIHLQRIDDQLVVTTVIDDLMKGLCGNAVHCMNLLFGLHERVGLLTKSSAL